MKISRLIILGALLTLPLSSQAQDTPPAEPAAAAEAPKPDSELDTNKDGKVDAAETKAVTEADADVSDVVSDGAEVAKAVGELKDAPKEGSKGMLVMGLLAAIFKLLLSLMKVLGKNIAWFKSKDGKRVIKYSTIGLGAAAGLVANLMYGMNWMDAGMIMLSGPLSVALHEYTKDSKDPPDADLSKSGPAPTEEAKADA